MNQIEKQIVVQAPADTVYQVWRNFENFPGFMDNIEEVRDIGDGRSHWKAKGPLGKDAEWDAELTVDEPAHAIAWRSVEGSSVTTAGRVSFDASGAATVVHLQLGYEAPGGMLGEVVAKLFANPDHQVEEDLQRFKDGLEGGQQFQFPGAGKLATDNGAPLGQPQTYIGADKRDEIQAGYPGTAERGEINRSQTGGRTDSLLHAERPTGPGMASAAEVTPSLGNDGDNDEEQA